jgi:hypothetical protein
VLIKYIYKALKPLSLSLSISSKYIGPVQLIVSAAAADADADLL